MKHAQTLHGIQRTTLHLHLNLLAYSFSAREIIVEVEGRRSSNRRANREMTAKPALRSSSIRAPPDGRRKAKGTNCLESWGEIPPS